MKSPMEVAEHWAAAVEEWEARTGRSALGEALASLPPSVRNSRKVRRLTRAIRKLPAK